MARRSDNTETQAGARRSKLTPPELARRWGVSPDKILVWIRSGELLAMNAATRVGQRPRYLIDVDDITAFQLRRMVSSPPKAKRCRGRNDYRVTEYF